MGTLVRNLGGARRSRSGSATHHGATWQHELSRKPHKVQSRPSLPWQRQR